MKRFLLASFLMISVQAEEATDLIVCGANEVFILSKVAESGEIKKSWSWQADSSPEIPEELRKTFASTDECKPYQDTILITSSSGGVAWVRREDHAALFHTSVRNAHSACLLPGKQVAVASSFGGDEVLIFSTHKSGANLKPAMKLPLKGAHGVVWDKTRKCLWALGTDSLLCLQQEKGNLVVLKTHPLPERGGHDLSWAGANQFFISVDENCFIFDCMNGKFEVFKKLAGQEKVKSIDKDSVTGRIVWHQGTKQTWWSHQIRFLDPDGEIELPEERIYKVRWDRPKPTPAIENKPPKESDRD